MDMFAADGIGDPRYERDALRRELKTYVRYLMSHAKHELQDLYIQDNYYFKDLRDKMSRIFKISNPLPIYFDEFTGNYYAVNYRYDASIAAINTNVALLQAHVAQLYNAGGLDGGGGGGANAAAIYAIYNTIVYIQASITYLQYDNTDYDSAFATLLVDFTNMEYAFTNLQNVINAHDAAITYTNTQVNNLSGTSTLHTNSINAHQNSLQQLDNDVNILKASSNIYAAAINLLQYADTTHTNNITANTNNIATLQASVNALQTDYTAYDGTIATVLVDVQQLQTDVNALDTRVTDHNNTLVVLQMYNVNRDATITTHTNDITNLKTRVSSLEANSPAAGLLNSYLARMEGLYLLQRYSGKVYSIYLRLSTGSPHTATYAYANAAYTSILNPMFDDANTVMPSIIDHTMIGLNRYSFATLVTASDGANNVRFDFSYPYLLLNRENIFYALGLHTAFMGGGVDASTIFQYRIVGRAVLYYMQSSATGMFSFVISGGTTAQTLANYVTNNYITPLNSIAMKAGVAGQQAYLVIPFETPWIPFSNTYFYLGPSLKFSLAGITMSSGSYIYSDIEFRAQSTALT